MADTRVDVAKDTSPEMRAAVGRLNTTLRLPNISHDYDHNDGKLHIHGLESETSMGLEVALRRAGIYCTSHSQQADGLHTLSVDNQMLVDLLIASGLNVSGSGIPTRSYMGEASRLEMLAMQGLARELNAMRLGASKSNDGGLILQPRDAIHRATVETKLHEAGIAFVDEATAHPVGVSSFKLTDAAQVNRLMRSGLNVDGVAQTRTVG